MEPQETKEEPTGLAEASTGTSVAEANMADPALDVTLPPASQKTPTGDQQVLAQTPEEVNAQYINAAGGLPGVEPTEPEEVSNADSGGRSAATDEDEAGSDDEDGATEARKPRKR